MITYRTAMRGICSSCLGILLLAGTAVRAQDGLADYDDDLSVYGDARPAAARGESATPDPVAGMEEREPDRELVNQLIHDRPGDFMEDFSGGEFKGGHIAGEQALFHAYFIEHGERAPVVLDQDPDQDVEVIITIRADAGLERKIRRYITRFGVDDWRALGISVSDGSDVR